MTRNDSNGEDNAGAATRLVLAFDPARYASEVAAFDLTDAQRHELLSTLWSIMRSFVDLGFTVDVCAAVFEDSVLIPDDGEVG